MSSKLIDVLGITPVSQFPNCPPSHPFTEFCETDRLCIPDPNPNIREVLEVCVSVIICSSKVICTPVGRKIVVEGKKQIKVTFVADDPCQSVHCAHFEIPFCSLILLGFSKDEVIQVCSAIEDISVQCLDCRWLTVTTIIFICPILKQAPNYCSSPHDDSNNY
ncbi:MAG: DUF3794 domain-containing protein [Sporomusaceae bacterium]|nr:DUF3794 domain-containing protein [Sporomusaceae bacterium]